MKWTNGKNPALLLTKEKLKDFYNHRTDLGKNPGWFILKTTSKQFKKLYNLKWDNKYKAYLEERHPYDLLLYKAMKYVKENDVNRYKENDKTN